MALALGTVLGSVMMNLYPGLDQTIGFWGFGFRGLGSAVLVVCGAAEWSSVLQRPPLLRIPSRSLQPSQTP